MVGLKRNTVKVIPYQEEWFNIYKEAETQLHRLLKEQIQFIEHIGSTAIRGLASKPIIDIVVAIEDFNKLETIRQILNLYNYEDRGERIGGYLFVKRNEDLTTHHIHIVHSLSITLRNYIAFKNKLNSDIKLRNQYSELKQKLAEKHKDNRGEYTKSKNEFISKVLVFIEEEKNTAANNASAFMAGS